MKHGFGGNVVSLVERAVPVIFPAISQVDAYWEGLRHGRLMPQRSEVDPRGLESALEYAFMLEHVAPGVARFRIAGMHLNNLLGMEVRGMPITAMFEPADRARIAGLLDRVVQCPQIADLRLTASGGLGAPQLPARLYLAPLGSDGKDHARILGCLQSLGQIGRSPRRFAIEHVHQRRIVASVGGQQPEPETKEPAPVAELAEDAAVFTHATPEPLERPRLRLVKTDS